jgi:hypothetical protein
MKTPTPQLMKALLQRKSQNHRWSLFVVVAVARGYIHDQVRLPMANQNLPKSAAGETKETAQTTMER